MPRHVGSPARFDDTDLAILEILLNEARIPIAELGQRVNVSRANAYTRIGHLQEAGVLKGFSARVDSAALGLGLYVIVLISLVATTDLEKFVDRVKALREVEFVAVTTGQFDAFIMARLSDVEALRTFLTVELQDLPGIQSTVTSIVVDELLRRPAVLPRKTKGGDQDPS